MTRIVHIKGNLTWKWGRTQQGSYVGICDPIAQTVQADRFAELVETMNEAMDSTFKELLSTGDLHNFLRERGWSADGRTSLSIQRGFNKPLLVQQLRYQAGRRAEKRKAGQQVRLFHTSTPENWCANTSLP